MFVLWSTISLFWTNDLSEGLSITQELYSGLLLFLIMPDILRTEDDIRAYFGFLMFVGILLGAITLTSQWYNGVKTMEVWGDWKFYLSLLNEKERAAGFAGVNYAATMLSFFVFMIISNLFFIKGKLRVLVFFVIFFC